MRSLELKIPPPLVTLAAGTLMWLLAKLPPHLPVPAIARSAAALVLASLGIAYAVAGVMAFRRARTTVNPTTPGAATALVCTGVYRLTRNPMYFGLLLCLTGWAVWLSQLLPFLVLPAFVAWLTRFQIEPEERALTALFGAQYSAYARRVRRW